VLLSVRRSAIADSIFDLYKIAQITTRSTDTVQLSLISLVSVQIPTYSIEKWIALGESDPFNLDLLDLLLGFDSASEQCTVGNRLNVSAAVCLCQLPYGIEFGNQPRGIDFGFN